MPKIKAKFLIPNILIFGGVLILVLSYAPLIKDELWFYLKELRGQSYELDASDGVQDSAFARYLTYSTVNLNPVDKKFSIVIERIGVNAPVIAGVSVTNPESYNEALKYGVAQASTSALPSENPGNVYLFAHASLNFWQLGKYATVFNLLRKLEPGDKIHLFYENRDFVYEVTTKEVVDGFNTYPLTRSVIEPVLTLQTCDPPGTTLNRLVITSKLLEVK